MKNTLKPKHFLISFSCALALTLFACGGGDSTPAVTTPPPPAAQAPAIATQPADQAIVAGQTATFTVSATGTSPLTYQWQKGGAAISAAAGATYTTPAAANERTGGAMFSVVVSNAAGSVQRAVRRSSPSRQQQVLAIAPSITAQQPAPQTVVAGQTATFSVTATGTAPLSYQWQKNGAAISGATLSTYTTPVVATTDSAQLVSCRRHQCFKGQRHQQYSVTDGHSGATAHSKRDGRRHVQE